MKKQEYDEKTSQSQKPIVEKINNSQQIQKSTKNEKVFFRKEIKKNALKRTDKIKCKNGKRRAFEVWRGTMLAKTISVSFFFLTKKFLQNLLIQKKTA